MEQKIGRIGIIGAMQIEVDGLKVAIQGAKTEVISGVEYTTGELCGHDVVVAACGIGKVFAAVCAEAMILRYGVSALLNTGVAGGLDDRLVVGNIVIADAVVQHDMNTTAIGDPRGFLSGLGVIRIPADGHLSALLADAARKAGRTVYCGTVASGDLFVAKDTTKTAIRRDFGAIACEMEGASIGTVAHVNGVPFAVLRAISDGGDGIEFADFAPVAARHSIEVTKRFLERL